MTPRDLTQEEKAFKTVLRAQVSAAGGGSAAAVALGCAPSLVSGWLSHENRFPSIAQVMQIEAASGQPIVSRWMTSCATADLPPPQPLGIEDIARLAIEVGQVKIAIIEAKADGTVDAADKAVLRREIHEAIALLSELLRKVEA